MDLGNPSTIVIRYFLIGEMICLGYQDNFPMVSALACMVIYWTGLMVNHIISYRAIMIHQATMLH